MIRRSLSEAERVGRFRAMRARTTTRVLSGALRVALAPLALTAILGCQGTEERAGGGEIAADARDATELADAGSADANASGDGIQDAGAPVEPQTDAVGPEAGAEAAGGAATDVAPGSQAGEAAGSRAGGTTPAPEPSERAAAETARPAPAAAAGAAPAVAPAAAPQAEQPSPLTERTPAPATAPAAPAAPPAPAASGQDGSKPSLVVSPTVYNGWKQFAANCERCHGQDVLGSSFAPDLRKSFTQGSTAGGGPLTKERFVDTVKNGRLEKGMPAWGPVLTDEQISDIHAYVTARASGQLLPGRPTREGS